MAALRRPIHEETNQGGYTTHYDLVHGEQMAAVLELLLALQNIQESKKQQLLKQAILSLDELPQELLNRPRDEIEALKDECQNLEWRLFCVICK